MDKKLKENLEQMEALHKKYLKKHTWGERFTLFGQTGFALVGNGLIMDAVNVFIHGIVFLTIMMFTWKFLLTLVIYAGLHLALLLFGSLRVKKYKNLLDQMQEEINATLSGYYGQMCERFGIQNECVAYEDGVVVGNGMLVAPKAEHVPQMQILQLTKISEEEKFNEYKKFAGTGTINDYIASLEFRKRFGIKTHFSVGSEEYMRFFTPDVQLDMVRSTTIQNFTDLEVLHDRICANFESNVKIPQCADVYQRAPLETYFLAVNAYCLNMRQLADRTHEAFTQMSFLCAA